MLKITSASQIPGLTSQRQHNWYNLLGKNLNESANVLEVGCGYGKSTWAWLDAMPTNINFYVLDCFSWPGQLHSRPAFRIESLRMSRYFGVSREFLKKHFNAHQRVIFKNVIQQHPKYDLIKEIFDNTFQQWKKTNNIKFDLVYLDADHSYVEVCSQLDYFSDCPCICGDDYSLPDVSKAVDEFVQKHNYKLETVGEFFVINT